MKKMCFILVMCLVLSYSSVVCAADEILYPSRLSSLMQDGTFNESENVVFEDGNCTSGVFYCEWSYDVYHVDLSKVTGDHLYLVDNSTSSRYSYSLYAQGKCVINTMRYYLTNGILDFNNTTSSSFSSGSYGMLSRDVSMVKEFFTTIPIFKSGDTESINAYLNDNDCSGATNYDDYLSSQVEPPFDEYDNDIPLPHNLQVLKGVDQTLPGGVDKVISVYPLTFTKDIIISWDQADVVDGMKYEVEGCITTLHLKENASGDTLEDYLSNTTAYYPLVLSTSYSGSKSITVTLPPSQMNGHKINGLLSKLVIRVRNTVDNKTSNWVSITIDFPKQTATATEKGYSDESVDGGNEYDNTIISDGGTVDINNISIGGITSYIKDGFGLLGNGGIISMMSSTFLYLPNSIWTIIKFFISSLIAISMIGAVVKIVF